MNEGIEKFILQQGEHNHTVGIAKFLAGSILNYDLRKCVRSQLEAYPSVVAFEGVGRPQNIIGVVLSKTLAPEILQLTDIYVNPDFRSKGIGSAMLKLVEEQAQQVGYEAIVAADSNIQPGINNSKRSATLFFTQNSFAHNIVTRNSRLFSKQLPGIIED